MFTIWPETVEWQTEDTLLITVREDDWRQYGKKAVLDWEDERLDNQEGVLVMVLEVFEDGTFTGKSWAGKVSYQLDDNVHVFTKAENAFILKDRYKGGF